MVILFSQSWARVPDLCEVFKAVLGTKERSLMSVLALK